jgi:hypothetical protein
LGVNEFGLRLSRRDFLFRLKERRDGWLALLAAPPRGSDGQFLAAAIKLAEGYGIMAALQFFFPDAFFNLGTLDNQPQRGLSQEPLH